jgi:mannose-6-phosphate isomerase
VRGETLPDIACHQGAGFEKLMDCFHYDAFDAEETKTRWQIQTEVIRETDNGKEVRLIGSNHTDRFRMHRLDTDLEFKTDGLQGFAIAIVVAGEGSLSWDGGEMEITQLRRISINDGQYFMINDGADHSDQLHHRTVKI